MEPGSPSCRGRVPPLAQPWRPLIGQILGQQARTPGAASGATARKYRRTKGIHSGVPKGNGPVAIIYRPVVPRATRGLALRPSL